MPKPAKTIVIFGGSKCKPGSPAYQQAYELGLALGRAGYQVANGGYGGTMEAAAKGARESHVSVIGVTCTAFGRSGPNAWLTQEIPTPNLNARIEALIQQGDGYVVLPGGTGTLVELAMVWELINKRFLPQRPIICLSYFWKPVVECVVAAGEMDGKMIGFVETSAEVATRLNDYFQTP